MSEWLAELQHPDSHKRKSAIAGLAKSKDTASVGTLEQVLLHDPDEHIRDYAAQAIRYIQKQTSFNPAAIAEPDFLKNVSFQDAPSQPSHHIRQPGRARHWWITDLTMHLTVNVLGGLLVALLILPRFASALHTPTSTAPGTEVDVLGRLSTVLLNAHLDELIIVGLLLGIFSVFGSFLTFRLIHQVAVHVFGGANTFPGMLHDTLMPYTIMSAVLYALYFMMSLANPLVVLSTDDKHLVFGVMVAVIALYGVAYGVLGHILGKAYAFGTSKGCLSIGIAFSMCGLGGFLMVSLFGTH